MFDAGPSADALAAVDVVLPAGQGLAEVLAARPAKPFSDQVVAFIEAFGRSLRSDPAIRRLPELVALGFWARAANIRRLKARFDAAYPDACRLPRGVAAHFAPSNVDTIFVYSLLLSMLAGNINVVRVSSRAGDQTNVLLRALGQALDAADPAVRSSVAIVRYDHDRAVTDALSARAALRIVWGGDATVDLIRQSPLSPTGAELVFPNKFSLAVFDADAWNAEPDKARVARGFVNDALWFSQMACASPRALVWRGSEASVDLASASLWAEVELAAEAMPLDWREAESVGKLIAEQDLATGDGFRILPTPSNRIRVVRAPSLRGLGDPPTASGGFFVEFRIETLGELAPAARRNWQTVVSHGTPKTEWRAFLQNLRPNGIDRIVSVGHALDFDAVWDGVDLLSAMTRLATVNL
jgi:hypothetical protein